MDVVWSGVLVGALMGIFLILWDAFVPGSVKNVGGGSAA